MKKEELIKMEEELSNEKLAQIIGGVSSSKISVTFSMASQPEWRRVIIKILSNDQHGISTRIV